MPLPERRPLKKRRVIRIKRERQEGGAGRRRGGRRGVWARRAGFDLSEQAFASCSFFISLLGGEESSARV